MQKITGHCLVELLPAFHVYTTVYVIHLGQSRSSFCLPSARSGALLPPFFNPKALFHSSFLTLCFDLINLTCISYTRMKAIFCFSSFIVRLFVHFFSEREANSETFVLVVHAVSSETHTYTHARAAAC